MIAPPNNVQTETSRAAALTQMRRHFQANQAVMLRQNLDLLMQTIKEMLQRDQRAFQRSSNKLPSQIARRVDSEKRSHFVSRAVC